MFAGRYNIGLTANEFYWYFAPCTNGTMAMIGNGAIASTHQIVYQTTINNIEPNTSYIISLEAANIAQYIQTDLSLFQFSINDVLLGDIFEIMPTPCQFTTFSTIWHNTNSTTAELKILNQNTVSDGNDFIMDNISLRKICKTTDTINIIFAPLPIKDTFIVNLCENELPYLYYDSIFSEAGVYQYFFKNNGVVDSIHIVNLSVSPFYVNTIDASICQGEVYNQNGFNENETGTYTQSYQTINGCDSLII